MDHEPDKEDVFLYLIGRDGLAYVEKKKITVRQAIKLIKQAGGLAELAHPGGERGKGPKISFAMVKKYKEYGLDAIEVYYPFHTDTDIKKFKTIAKQLDLIATGGSDYHGGEYTKISCKTMKRE